MKVSSNKRWKKWLMGVGIFLAFLVFSIIVCYDWVQRIANASLYDDLTDIPANDVGLVLGTAPVLQGGYANPYFTHRIEAAAALYRAGKVKHFILSGDNSRKNYNEPADMQTALVAAGVPKSATTLDYAGFRTLDSVVRCQAIFQQNRFTIVSQAFHNARAVFIADHFDLEVVGYNAQDPQQSNVAIREYLARCKAFLDLYLLNKQPKYLGEQINIEIN